MKLFSICGALGACSAFVLVTGCTGVQMPPQSAGAPQASTPDVVTKCPEPLKLYTTGTSNGRVVAGDILVPVFGLRTQSLRVPFRYDNWPKSRSIVTYKPELTTCGAQAGKKPLGEITRSGVHQWYPPKCDPKTSRCSYYYEVTIEYHATMKPPGKEWKYDYVRIVPEKPTKGYGALPLILIEVFP